MELRTLNFNKYNRKYQIKEVTNFNIEGLGTLFDPSIFGYGDVRRERCGYISLGGPFIDPATFDISRRLFRELAGIVDGSRYYKIAKDGSLEPSSEAEGGSTGLKWFYDNFDRIRFTKLENSENNKLQTRKMKEAYTSLKREEFFIKNILVIPLHYRDVDTTSHSIKIDELNQFYIDLIKATSFKKRMVSSTLNDSFIDTKIQGLLMNIFDYLSNMNFGKDGAQRQLAMGRSIDNAARVIITAPEIKRSDIIGDTRYNLDKSIVPLHHILDMHPVHTVSATHQLLQSFREKGLMGNVDVDEFEAFYTDEWIEDQVETYSNTFAHRLDAVPTPTGGTIDLRFDFIDDETEEESSMIRPLTFIELFYLAVEMFRQNSRIVTTRYPIIGKDSLLYSKIEVGTFIKDVGNMKIYIPANDQLIYDMKYYPNPGLKTKDNIDSSLFDETVRFSNMMLEGLDGDYDEM